MNEPQMTNTIGSLMKAARKFRKLSQSDVAHAIGCSQSALSKMEHDLLTPNAPQWFLFSRFTSIPPETIEMGVIDRHSPIGHDNAGMALTYKLPRRYRTNRFQKVREVYPFLIYLEKKVGGKDFKHFFESLEIDSEFFLDFDNMINFQMIVDFINHFIAIGKTSPEDIKGIIDFGQNDLYWDKFQEAWKQYHGQLEVLTEFSKAQAYFQADFKVTIELLEGVILLSYIPEPHLYPFLKDVTPESREWLTYYRKFTLETLVKKSTGVSIEARPVPEVSRSFLETHFEIH